MILQYEGNDTYHIQFDTGKQIELIQSEIDEFEKLNIELTEEVKYWKTKSYKLVIKNMELEDALQEKL